MFERFTDRARKVMALANQEAQRFNHEYLGTEHMLLGLVKEGSGVGSAALKNLGINLKSVRIEVEKLVKPGPEHATMGKLPHAEQSKRAVENAILEARNLNHNYVGTEHLLLGLLQAPEDSISACLFKNMGVTMGRVKEEISNLLGESTEEVELHESTEEVELHVKEQEEILVPFTFRFVKRNATIEVVGSEGNVISKMSFPGPLGEYAWKAIKRYEPVNALLTDLDLYLKEIGEDSDRLGRGVLPLSIITEVKKFRDRIENFLTQ